MVCQLVFDLNWTLGFFSGDRGTATEERGCMNIWMTPSEKEKVQYTLPLLRSQMGEQELNWNLLFCEQCDLTLHRNNVKSELLAGKYKNIYKRIFSCKCQQCLDTASCLLGCT